MSLLSQKCTIAVCAVTTLALFLCAVSTMDEGNLGLREQFREYIYSLRGVTKVNNKGARARSGVTLVLILTYMRSGSSMVGGILQHATEAFYLFEPFHDMRKANENKTIITYINGSKSSPPFDLNKEKNDAIYNWFTCDIQKISKTSFYGNYMKKAEKSNQTFRCLTSNQNLSQWDRDQKCAYTLKETFLNSPIRIIKTIRTNLASAGQLLKNLPYMKIIHLVRDPRATMYSRSSIRECRNGKGGIKTCTQQYCQSLQNDVKAMDRLAENYPNQIRTFFYEDVALYPVETSKRIYDFVGETFTESARKFLTEITSAKEDNGSFGIYRCNSSNHVSTWKAHMDATLRHDVQKQCKNVFKRYKGRYAIV